MITTGSVDGPFERSLRVLMGSAVRMATTVTINEEVGQITAAERQADELARVGKMTASRISRRSADKLMRSFSDQMMRAVADEIDSVGQA